jgi:hypothetical protein
VDWSTAGAGGGSCTSVGVDYESGSGTITFDAGENSKTFSVLLCADHASDNGESVSLNLSNVQNAALDGPASATLQILDAATEFTNMQPLTIGGGAPSSPYGGSVEVSGHTSISGLKLTLFGVNYANPEDLDVLLVGPNGETFVVAAGVGGDSALSNATITLEDDALLRLPDSDAITEGQNYRPAVCTASGTVAAYPAPAPSAPYTQAGCTSDSATFSSVFGNIGPNGMWKLYIRDDSGDPVVDGEGGSIAGWGIQLLAPTAAEVSVSGSVRTPQGMGIRGAVVTITGGGMSEPVTAVTGTFGTYHFRNIPAGVSYVVTVRSRRYAFAQPSRMVSVRDNVAGVDFISEP